MFGVENGRPVPPQQFETPAGWIARAPARGITLQFRPDGFTFSKLPPYSSWSELTQEALPSLSRFANHIPTDSTVRLGIRCINQLDLPAAFLTEYLTAPPAVAPLPAPQALTEFFTRTVTQDSDRDCFATVIQTRSPTAPPGQLRLILDIDAFRMTHREAKDLNLDAFEPLHALRNQIFFASLTDATVDKYE